MRTRSWLLAGAVVLLCAGIGGAAGLRHTAHADGASLRLQLDPYEGMYVIAEAVCIDRAHVEALAYAALAGARAYASAIATSANGGACEDLRGEPILFQRADLIFAGERARDVPLIIANDRCVVRAYPRRASASPYVFAVELDGECGL